MGLKTLSFLTLLLPSLYILLSSLSLPNLAQAEPTNNNNDSTYLTVSLSNKDANTIAKLDKYITNDNTKITNYPTILNIEANSSVGYLATVSTDKSHSNLTREKTNPNDQANQVINPVQASYNEQEVVYRYYNGVPTFTQTGGSSLTNNTWGFLPISNCSLGGSNQNGSFSMPCEKGFAQGYAVITADAFKLARFYQVPTKDNPVTLKDAAAEIGKTKSQTFYIYYGAKLSNSLPAGTYSTNVVYTVTPKLPVEPVVSSYKIHNKNIKQISLGALHSCALVEGDDLYCWGNNKYGALGDGTRTDSLVPKLINRNNALEGKKITEISVGTNSTCAIADSKVYCWGKNSAVNDGDYGYTKYQLGDGTATDRYTPTLVKFGRSTEGAKVEKLASEVYHSCVLIDKKPYCWGWNYWGNLGIGGKNEHALPVQPNFSRYPELANAEFSDIAVGGHNTCAIAKGKAYCWGNNNYGQLGVNIKGVGGDYRSVPQKVYDAVALKGVVLEKIEVGSYNVCAFGKKDGENKSRLFCWGNIWGELGVGDGTKNERSAPVEIRNLEGIERLGASYFSVLADDYIWGMNINRFASGNRQKNYNLSPTKLNTNDNVFGQFKGGRIEMTSLGPDHLCSVIDLVGRINLACMGANNYGQLGDGSKTRRASFTAVNDTWNYSSGSQLTFQGNNLQNVDDIYSIYLDLNRNGKKDANEICQITDKGDSQLTCLTPQNNIKGVYDIFLNNAIGATNTKIGSFEYK